MLHSLKNELANHTLMVITAFRFVYAGHLSETQKMSTKVVIMSRLS